MKEIEFLDIDVKLGHIVFRFVEKLQSDNNFDTHSYSQSTEYENTVYIQFDSFIPSNDTVALVLGSFCGKAYRHVFIDLDISRYIYEFLKSNLGSKISVRGILENSPADKDCLKTDDASLGSDLILNFSGGIDSLALMYCLPPETKKISIYFEGFEREYNYFSKYPTNIVKTDVRKKLSLDTNSVEFMGLGAILYRDYFQARFMTFGTILEAGSLNIMQRIPSLVPQSFFFGTEMELLQLSHSLTELGTAMIVAKYAPNELPSSLDSLAIPGSEKLYRKECLVNIACSLLGLKMYVGQYHYPRAKQEFGDSFASDFLSFCIAKHLGTDYVLNLYKSVPEDYEQFVNSHNLDFYRKIKQDMLSQSPERLISYFVKQCRNAGLSLYTDYDYKEMEEVREFLARVYQTRSSKPKDVGIKFVLDMKKLQGCRSVILYGAGNVGRDYYKQITGHNIPVYWIDEKDKYYKGLGYDVNPVESLVEIDYDVILLATVNDSYIQSMRANLLNLGIPKNKIITAY